MQNSPYLERNRKVAQNRGESWKNSLKAGKLDARLRPTKLMIARVQKGLNQSVVAGAIGVSLSTYGGVERRNRVLSVESFNKLKNVLGAEVTKFFKKQTDGTLIAI